MGKKKKTLPKNFDELIEVGDISALKEVFMLCELDARGGYSKSTALSFFNIPNELVSWLVEQGADINASDSYGRTALHKHAISWCGNTELLLELGADIEAIDYQNETPLFAAAASFKPNAVNTLIAKGANISAENKMKQTPLEKALAMCRNIDIVNMAKVADILLNAGATVTQKMKDSIKRIGNDFEFHREGFNKEYLNQTEEALLHLYELFDVPPIGKRKTHNGTSPIEVSAKGWQAQHNELWNLLIPSQGHAKTVQGEVIRITGKVSYEILDNGSINWDDQYRKMLNSLNHYFSLGTPLHPDALLEAERLAKELHNGNGSNEPVRLCELAVNWVLSNLDPITLEQPDYKR
ncbi:ankyrin [Lysinibacillus sphaericus]|uniref:ankyrin repeat domain-containing protein n=1 Tax=Lysinibacillus sphaericus TaxID=1421 RepID=UPI0018CCECE1|nr:ankyrin repeat domain-containing protein [Lysinibacillus sphaericus]MBG9455662.1 ankyrin [Lysinibacillus sphaericus]MBG9479080.1 ankyrin [Lysinibacillus sphaericus]MBG9591264.1 ankyrin [Lysinibacillus sphaericus]